MIKNLLQSIVPERLFPSLVRLRNTLFEGPRKSYSQFGEDIVLEKLLKKKIGFFVVGGAYHPSHYSNTYLLYKKGWRGINIDPNSDTIKLFEKWRGGDVSIQKGVSGKSGFLTLYTFSHSNWNTFSKEKAERWKRRPGVNFLGEQKVACSPLRDILDEHLPKDTEIDLLNIDAEGMDLEVLLSNDWARYSPRVIVVESAEFDPHEPSKDEIFRYLQKEDYRLYAFMGVSLIFLKKDE